MSRDDIVPHQSSSLKEAELTGLDEIRVALKEVEELKRKGLDARIEILDDEDGSGLCATLRSFRELQEFITQRYSRMLTEGVNTAIPLDDFERLVTETRIRLLDDTEKIRGCVRIG